MTKYRDGWLHTEKGGQEKVGTEERCVDVNINGDITREMDGLESRVTYVGKWVTGNRFKWLS